MGLQKFSPPLSSSRPVDTDMLVGQSVAVRTSYSIRCFLPGRRGKEGRIRVFVRELGYGEEGMKGLRSQIDRKLGFIHSFAHKTDLFQVCIMGFQDNPSL